MRFIDKIKMFASWILWPSTYVFMHLLSPFISVRTYYEDSSFNGVQRPLIIISNHKQIFDPWYISFAFPFGVFFGKIFPLRPYSTVHISEKNVAGRILKHFGIVNFTYFVYNTIPIPDADTFEDKITPLVNAVKNGESALLFPEGRLASGESVSEFKKGAVRIHELTKAPILPVAVRYQKKFPPFAAIYISIGKPTHIPEELLKKGAENDFYDAREFLRGKVEELYKKINLS